MVTDANGSSVTSPTTSLQVDQPLLATPGVGPFSGAVPLNVSFSSFVSGGVPPYLTRWTFGDGNSSSLANTTHTYARAGLYLATFWENDSGGGSYNSTTNITVTLFPLAESNPTPSSIDLGQPVTFSVNITGGTGIYSISWSGLPAPCVSSNSSRLAACTPNSIGPYTVGAVVRDSADDLQFASETFNVYSDPVVRGPAFSPIGVDAGQNVRMTATPSGGSGSFAYTWSGLPPGCATQNTSVLNCVPTSKGTYPISVSIVDSNGEHASSVAADLVVSPPLNVTAISLVRLAIEVGQTAQASTAVTGGASPYSYTWTGLPANCDSVNGSTLTCSPSHSGTFDIGAEVSDANQNLILAAVASLTVYPMLMILAFAYSNGSVLLGSHVSLNVSLSGGKGPFVLTFFELPLGCSPANSTYLSCTPTVSGSFATSVRVGDALGGMANASTNVTILPAGKGNTGAPNTTYELEIGAGLALALAACGLAGLLVYRRRRIRQPPGL